MPKIVAQTNLFNPVTIYDTRAPRTSSPVRKAILDWLNPVVQVQGDNGMVLYKTGDFYDPVGMYWLAGFAGILLIGGMLLLSKR